MANFKRVSGDYNLISVSPSNGDNVNIITHTVNISGNLDVSGNVTYINVNDLTVDDPFITVAGNNSGTLGTAPFQQQGLVAQTSGNTFAGIRFDNGNLTWQISPSVDANGAPIVAYANLSSGAAGTVAGSNTQIQFNDSSAFGASANLAFDKATNKITIQGHQSFGNIVTAPTATANAVALYHNAEGSGGTGLYIKSLTTEDELVSKTKAIVFSIIF
jgi:hypothetical protein